MQEVIVCREHILQSSNAVVAVLHSVPGIDLHKPDVSFFGRQRIQVIKAASSLYLAHFDNPAADLLHIAEQHRITFAGRTSCYCNTVTVCRRCIGCRRSKNRKSESSKGGGNDHLFHGVCPLEIKLGLIGLLLHLRVCTIRNRSVCTIGSKKHCTDDQDNQKHGH